MPSLERLQIGNFKGISSCTLDDLRAVNVLVGRNNAGKSTILEALYFIKSLFGGRDEIGRLAIRRIMTRRSFREKNDLTRLSFRYQNPSRISLKFRDLDESIFDSKFQPDRISSSLDLSVQGIGLNFSVNESESGITSYRFKGQSGSGGLMSLGDRFIQEPLSSSPTILNSLNFLSQVVLIDDVLMREVQEIERSYIGTLVRTGEVEKLIEILNAVYASDITQMIFLDSPSGFKLFLRSPSGVMDIDDFGDGFRYAFSTLAIAQAVKNTAILLEEPENHQHSGALVSLFKALLQIAQSNGLQIFVSTHSLEVVAALSDLALESTRVFHIKREQDGKIISTAVEGRDLKLCLDLGIDVRYLQHPQNKLVLVEGPIDDLFLETVISKLYGRPARTIGFNISPQDSKDNIFRSVRAVSKLRLPITVFVMPDYDDDDSPKTLKRIESCLTEVKYRVENNQIFLESGPTLVCLPLGLPDDDEIRKLKKYFQLHAMEDYLLKILGNSPRLLKTLGYESFDQMMGALFRKPIPSGAKIAKDHSKGYLALLALENSMGDRELYTRIIDECGDKLLKDILQPLQPLLEI